MRTLVRGFTAAALLAAGYVLGSINSFPVAPAAAQEPDELSDTAIDRIKAADAALKIAAQTLEQEGRNKSVIRVLNPLAIVSGGIDAQDDLAKGAGVDPVTFAALYAGYANSDIADNLNYDSEGRLTYDGRVIRMYSIKRLKELFAERARILGEDAP